jgi:ABC-2 type transport system ATP-binding protein
VPEESNVYTELTGWDNLMFTARLYLVERNERALRAQKLLEDFGLWEKRDVKVEDYSKGMRRRLSIAMAIIHQPSLLFLDEPTPGLDAESTRSIRDLIRRLNGGGTTIFLTTHQIEEANQLCDRVAILKEGKIVAIDTPENLKGAFQRVQSVEFSVQEEENHLSGGPGSQHLAWSDMPGVISIDKRGDKWRLFTDDPSALLPRIIDHARENQLRITSLNTIGPSLEDVFLDITSR